LYSQQSNGGRLIVVGIGRLTLYIEIPIIITTAMRYHFSFALKLFGSGAAALPL
jgi:hypothetical protein